MADPVFGENQILRLIWRIIYLQSNMERAGYRLDAISSSGVGSLVFTEGTMDRYGYKNILEQNLKADCG